MRMHIRTPKEVLKAVGVGIVTAVLLSPFLPNASAEILSRIGASGALEQARLPEAATWGQIAVGAETTKGAPLFPRREMPDAEDDGPDQGPDEDANGGV